VSHSSHSDSPVLEDCVMGFFGYIGCLLKLMVAVNKGNSLIKVLRIIWELMFWLWNFPSFSMIISYGVKLNEVKYLCWFRFAFLWNNVF